MKKTFALFLTVVLNVLVFQAYAQLNIDSLSHINYQSLHNTFLNDVWGYTDEFGNEYALVGARNGVSVVDVTQPTNPQEVFWHPSKYSTWRDLKTFGDYAYVTTEADTGLLIMDLSGLPGNTTISTSYFTGGNGIENLNTAHNLWIDDNGFCYIFGANIGNGGVQIYDLNNDPLQPVWVGEFDADYCHDGFVRNDTAYFAHIYEGYFTVVDVSDKANPVQLGLQNTPTNFAHNIWPSEDGNTVFTTDEITNSYIAAYDVSNPASIVELDRIQSQPGTNTIPHNAHVLGDYVITSYYADGVVIHDVSDPNNMIEVGNYDTYPGTSTSTIGNWGAYPYFPSGNIMVTDIQYGFFILGPTYVQAAKLEGHTTNAQNGNDLDNVRVNIANHDQTEFSKLNGVYKTGIAVTDTRTVDYYKYGFVPETRTVSFVNGQTTIEDVALTPIQPFDLTVHVEDENGNSIFGAEVFIAYTEIDLSGTSNGFGDADFNLYYEDDYAITVGKWGYFTVCQDVFIDQNTQTINVVLETGYYDDFTFDFGWSAFGDAVDGLFVRAKPILQGDPWAPEQLGEDSPWDCGEMAYVTGNGTNYEDVTDGSVFLVSPIFDATYLNDPHVNYRRFFYCMHGPNPPPDDTLFIKLSNGFTTVTIDQVSTTGSYFIDKSIRISDFITPTANMSIRLEVSDFMPNNNITEVVFDEFYLSNQNNSATENVEDELALIVYPNPAATQVFLETKYRGSVQLYDQMGRLVLERDVNQDLTMINVERLERGIYTLVLAGEVQKVVLQ